MPIFHAFEILTEGSAFMEVDRDAGKLFARLCQFHPGVNEIESLTLGAVEAASVADAIDQIRAGRWRDPPAEFIQFARLGLEEEENINPFEEEDKEAPIQWHAQDTGGAWGGDYRIDRTDTGFEVRRAGRRMLVSFSSLREAQEFAEADLAAWRKQPQAKKAAAVEADESPPWDWQELVVDEQWNCGDYFIFRYDRSYRLFIQGLELVPLCSMLGSLAEAKRSARLHHDCNPPAAPGGQPRKRKENDGHV